MVDQTGFFFKAMNFIYTKILTYGYLAEILLFIFLVALVMTILFLILNTKYFKFMASEKLRFLRDYVFLFIKEKINFLRSALFEFKKFIREVVGYKIAFLFVIGSIIIITGIILFILYLKKKYLS